MPTTWGDDGKAASTLTIGADTIPETSPDRRPAGWLPRSYWWKPVPVADVEKGRLPSPEFEHAGKHTAVPSSASQQVCTHTWPFGQSDCCVQRGRLMQRSSS
jgi:hypothetical protein